MCNPGTSEATAAGVRAPGWPETLSYNRAVFENDFHPSSVFTGCVSLMELLSFSVSHFFSYPMKKLVAPTSPVLQAAPRTSHSLSIANCD